MHKKLPSYFHLSKYHFFSKDCFGLFSDNDDAARFGVSVSGNMIKFNCRNGKTDIDPCANYIKQFSAKEQLELTCSDIYNTYFFDVTAKDQDTLERLIQEITTPDFTITTTHYFNFSIASFLKDNPAKFKAFTNERANTFNCELLDRTLTILTLPEMHSHTDEYFGDLQKEQIIFFKELFKPLNITYTEHTKGDKLALSVSKVEDIYSLMDVIGKFDFWER